MTSEKWDMLPLCYYNSSVVLMITSAFAFLLFYGAYCHLKLVKLFCVNFLNNCTLFDLDLLHIKWFKVRFDHNQHISSPDYLSLKWKLEWYLGIGGKVGIRKNFELPTRQKYFLFKKYSLSSRRCCWVDNAVVLQSE